MAVITCLLAKERIVARCSARAVATLCSQTVRFTDPASRERFHTTRWHAFRTRSSDRAMATFTNNNIRIVDAILSCQDGKKHEEVERRSGTFAGFSRKAPRRAETHFERAAQIGR
jgi:type IV secretory pathway VirJ component